MPVSEQLLRYATQFATYSSSAAGTSNMLKKARSEAGIAIAPAQFDRDPFLLNLTNGTLDLRTGELLPHDSSRFITKVAPVAYDAEAKCAMWLEFLNKIFAADCELIAYVQRLAGYCLTGDVREQIIAILHGTGANGKSTFLNVLMEIHGDYAVKTAEGLLVEHKGEVHPTIVAALFGKRLAVASETSANAKLDEARVKELTSCDLITARRMREDYWEFPPTHKILVATNHRPKITGTDYAIWRRVKLIPFSVTIPAAEQDRQLGEKLRAEYPGILAWMVRGCLDWQANGLGSAAKVEDATAGYRQAEDSFAEFLAACCELEADASVTAGDLLKSYAEHCGDRGMTARAFALLLKSKGFTSKRMTSGEHRNKMLWCGLRLN